MIRLSIKGPKKSATRAASRRGLTLKNCSTLHPKFGSLLCDVPCTKDVEVFRWFAEKGHMKTGRGATPGTLLFFSTKSCKRKSSLSGSKAKRRRKRRR